RCIAADAGPGDSGGDAGPGDAGDGAVCEERVWYADGDGDGHGDDASSAGACEAPVGYVEEAGDCDDASAAVHPGAAEVCNGADDDCDAALDEGLSPWADYFVDADGDGHGSGAAIASACAAPPGHALVDDDCDDADAATHPEAAEVCNDLDDDCDELADEGLQRLIGVPIELVADGYEEPVAAISLGAEYGAVWFSRGAGLVAGRIGHAGVRLDAGVSVSTSSMHDGRLALTPAGEGRAVVAWGERVSASESVLRARLVTFGSPIELGPPVEVTRQIDVFGPIAIAATGARIVLAWETSWGHVNGRVYDADLGAPETVRTLYAFDVVSLELLVIPGEADFVLALLTAQRAGDPSPQAYADRVVLSPLTIEGRYARLGDGRGVGLVSGAVMADGGSAPVVGAVVVYESSAELVRFAPGAFGTAITVLDRAALDTGAWRIERSVSVSARSGHWDIGAQVVSTEGAAVSWAHAGDVGAPGAGTTVGVAHFVRAASVARLSPSRGAIFWVSTATASIDTSLWMQRIGCE
ncbi:MAG: putative metal-binding motif-containing protein, partial [Myxococcota bacterium]|nr:putative metal-binding motif-containing protein [Myxococcota bacterium]